jgi:hypothetical protein
MLDTDTKRRIDTARDILVGKVPDLKRQGEDGWLLKKTLFLKLRTGFCAFD